jgi:2-oxo-4-hydroxy-4-carboxy-5-ureidoimidazoline decarboxylase
MGSRVESAATLGESSRDAFVASVGFAYESSPWVAERAYDRGPFDDLASVIAALRDCVDAAGEEEQLALIRAHPDLAGRAAVAGGLTPASTSEQASAGLDRLDPATHARLTGFTTRYRNRFGFPYVVCVREHTLETIVGNVKERISHDRPTEVRTAIAEIHKIAALRLRDR